MRFFNFVKIGIISFPKILNIPNVTVSGQSPLRERDDLIPRRKGDGIEYENKFFF